MHHQANASNPGIQEINDPRIGSVLSGGRLVISFLCVLLLLSLHTAALSLNATRVATAILGKIPPWQFHLKVAVLDETQAVDCVCLL